MEYKKLEFRPVLDAWEFPNKVGEELAKNDINTHTPKRIVFILIGLMKIIFP